MTQTTVNTKTIENGLVAVYSALVLDFRPDGSRYRRISETHPDGETVREIVRELHTGELPNDWRYETIYDLAQGLLEYSEPSDHPWTEDEYAEVVPDIAINLSDTFSADLLEWGKIGSRLEFDWDEFPEECDTILDLLQARQREEIETMGYYLLRLVNTKLT